ncbi:hypothetical protein HYH03_004679 [Edaphochlamys debaryana]|uniref:Chromo domain-containing protein n=1 Tax=Edaphochlamys debaryana TaxID=47281 RepID=A0A836C217_9CHLO|nr:hypothetical protein HYH03_004679 [Edaphochlamys debaryana]|eukprot:KAG2497531.1 hypothetical protein HYH03_004679 [Edaphochlamys debaryana]
MVQDFRLWTPPEDVCPDHNPWAEEPAEGHASNAGAKPRRYRVGDKVQLLLNPGFLASAAPELRAQLEGPFVVSQVCTARSVRLHLPHDVREAVHLGVHSIIHVSRLAPVDDDAMPAPALGKAAKPVSGPGSFPISVLTEFDDVHELDPHCEEDAVVGVKLAHDKQAKKACLFRIRWAECKGREDSWESFAAVSHLPCVRAFLRTAEFQSFKASDRFSNFASAYPERAPRLVRFAPSAE